MNITDHIVSLLKSGKNVELNGIGAFIIKTQDAYMDESTNTFYPAKQTVEFQPYSDDKGNIVELIARKECVDENTAKRMWQNYSGALTEKLQSQHSHTFPELGDLRLEDGEYRFYPIDGLNLLGNNESYKPIVGVEKFDTNTEEDPFAVFDNPESVAPVVEETIDETEPEPAKQDEITKTEEPQPVEQPVEQPVPEQVAEVVAATAATEEPEPAENTPAETSEPTPSPALAAKENAEQLSEEEVPDLKEDDLRTILDDEPDVQQFNDRKSKHNRNKKIVIVLLIVLLLLLWGGAAYYYFFIYKKNAKPVQESDKASVTQTDSTLTSESQLKPNEGEDSEAAPEDETAVEPETTPEAETAVAEAEEPATDANTDNGALAKVANDYNYNKFNSSFAYDLSTVTVSDPDAVETNKNQILKRLSGRIKTFVTGKQYSTAADKLEAKLGEFVTERLEDKFGIHPEDFQISDLMPYTTDNFVRKYVGDELQTRKQRRVRYEVIEEIFNNNILGQYLDELINSGEVMKDVAKAAPAPVYTAPLYTNPKQGFDVIAGTYRDKQSAMRMASSLRSKGAGAYVIERGGLYYVSAGSAPSRTAADKVMFQLKTWYTSNLSIKQW